MASLMQRPRKGRFPQPRHRPRWLTRSHSSSSSFSFSSSSRRRSPARRYAIQLRHPPLQVRRHVRFKSPAPRRARRRAPRYSRFLVCSPLVPDVENTPGTPETKASLIDTTLFRFESKGLNKHPPSANEWARQKTHSFMKPLP